MENLKNISHKIPKKSLSWNNMYIVGNTDTKGTIIGNLKASPFTKKSPNKSCAISSYQVGREKKAERKKKGLLPIIAEIDYFCSILKHSIVA